MNSLIFSTTIYQARQQFFKDRHLDMLHFSEILILHFNNNFNLLSIKLLNQVIIVLINHPSVRPPVSPAMQAPL